MLRRLYILNLKAMLRDKGSMLFLVLFPVGMTALFGFIQNANVQPMDLGVVYREREPVAEALVSDLSHLRGPGGSPVFVVQVIRTEDTARDKLREGEIDAALIVPPLTDPGIVTLLHDEKELEKQQRAIVSVGAAIQGYNLKLAGEAPRVGLEARGLRGIAGQGAFTNFIPFLLLFSVVLSSLQFGVSRIVRYRQQGVFKRLMVTPLPPRTLATAELFTRVTIAAVQAVLLLIAGTIAFDGRVTASLLWVVLLAVAGSMILMNIGLVLVSLASNPEVANGIANISGTLLVILGGGISETLLSGPLATALGYLPIGPIAKSIRVVMLEQSSPLQGAGRETLIVLVWLVASTAAAMQLFRFKPPTLKASKG